MSAPEETFERERPRLLGVAYGMLGSYAEAEDVVQEAWLRWERVGPATVRDPAAWLTTVVARLALDALGSARARREAYVGPWLPEPLVVAPGADPADRVTLDETVSLALMAVLERLSPAQRTAFVLHDVFGLSFDEVGEVVGRSPEAVRKLASRARRDVQAAGPSPAPARKDQERVVAAFAAAAGAGDLEGLVAVLDPDVVWRSDGGGRVTALRRPLHGASRVARALLGFARRPARGGYVADVNGEPGLVFRDADGVLTVLAFTVRDGRITQIHAIRNPEKVRHVPDPASVARPPGA